MRRKVWTASLVVVFLGACVFLLRPFLLPAPSTAAVAEHTMPTTVSATSPASAELGISQVVLYSSGVGHFLRQGKVEGNAAIDLSFPVQNINDLLKSMVLQDLGKGQVSAVSYDSHDPIAKTLKSFALNLNDNPSLGQMLNQARGEKVEVQCSEGNLTGTLLGVESRQPPAGKEASAPSAPVETLNLLCADGMRGLRLSDTRRVRFLNPQVEGEIRRALEVLASARDAQKKSVRLNFTGAGQRTVKVSYVVEQPVWRTSYRLLVDKAGKLFVQGWAIVENTSNEDWKDVRMALVSGRPISFQMDLYQPLYVSRPVVQQEQAAAIQPQTHGSAVYAFQNCLEKSPSCTTVLGAMPTASAPAVGAPAPPAVGGMGHMTTSIVSGPSATPQIQGINLQGGVVAAATASDLGDFFQYVIAHPVTVPRQKSAMLPIVNQGIEGTKVSLYNPATHPKYPLLALELKNSTGLHLMQGPVAVFDGANYAGDAQLLDLPAGQKRLVSYALDLGIEVGTVSKEETVSRVRVKIQQGTISCKMKPRQTTTYKATNRSEYGRVVWFEHPFQSRSKLVSQEQPRERTDAVYRFEVRLPAGKTANLKVTEEREEAGKMASNECDLDSLRQMLRGKCSSPKLKEVLKKALELQEKLAAGKEELTLKQQQLQSITQDQERLRANLKEMPPSAAAYKRYLAKFDNQETEIEKLQERIKTLQIAEQQQRKEFVDFLSSVDVEGEITGLEPNIPSSDPVQCGYSLLKQSENLRQIEHEWRRFSNSDQPSYPTPAFVNDGKGK